MEKLPPISVIMPAHNAEKYLSLAVGSVLRQSLSAWELIIVDDASSDNTANLLQTLSAADNRLRVLRTEKNIGPGPARNLGMENARGEYILFADADDELHQNCLQTAVDLAETHGGDLVCFGANFVNEAGSVLYPTETLEGDYTASGWQNVNTLLNAHFSTVVWDVLIKRRLIQNNKLLFTPTTHEDTWFKFRLMFFAEHIVCTKKILYKHYLRHDSLINKRHIEVYSHVKTLFVMLDYVREFIETLRKTEPVSRAQEYMCYRFMLSSLLNYTQKTALSMGNDFLPLFDSYAHASFGDKSVYFTTLYELFVLRCKMVTEAEEKNRRAEQDLAFAKKSFPELAAFFRRREIAQLICGLKDDEWSIFPALSWYGEYWELVKNKESNPCLRAQAKNIVEQLSAWGKKHTDPLKQQELALALALYLDLPKVITWIEPEIWPEKLRQDFIAAFVRNCM